MPLKNASRAGYSLIELLIVVSLMGILAAMIVPRFEPSIHDQLQGVAQILAADLAYARNLAVTNDSQYSITFQRATNSYVLQHSGTNNLLDALPFTPYRTAGDSPDQQTTFLEDLPHLGSTVHIVGGKLGGGTVSASVPVEFNALGGVEGGQTVTLWISCGSGDARRYQSIVIAPVTGLVSMGEFRAAAP